MCIALMTAVNGIAQKDSSYLWLGLGVVCFLLLLSGFISGIIGCFGIKKHGWKTTLRPSIIGLILNISIFTTVTVIAVNSFFDYREKAKNQYKLNAIQNFIEQANLQLPKLVDDQTRLDKIIVIDINNLKYNFTFIDIEKKEIQSIDEFITENKLNLDNTYKTSDQFKMFRDNKISLQYDYYDKNGELVASINIGE